MKLKKGELQIHIVSYIFVAIMVFLTVYPVLYTLMGSLKTNLELTSGGRFFPEKMQINNYVTAFVKGNFFSYTMNSVIVSLAALVIATITGSMAGFTLARRIFIGKKLILALYVSMLFVALGSVTLYPMYFLLRSINLHKSIYGLILALVGGQASNVLLVMGFTMSIPKELDEAAIIDGCSIYGVFFRIVFPLLKPILGVVALFTFRSAWNDYIRPLILSMGNPRLRTLTVGVVQLKYAAQAAVEWHIMLAGASIAIIPRLVVYLFANKQFISGLTAGSVKG
jgi:ABC-type glycerol-3-phosphate transport system permease component